ncbi:hypothetical protein ABKN59_009860 [Abortiporus biennis]
MSEDVFLRIAIQESQYHDLNVFLACDRRRYTSQKDMVLEGDVDIRLNGLLFDSELVLRVLATERRQETILTVIIRGHRVLESVDASGRETRFEVGLRQFGLWASHVAYCIQNQNFTYGPPNAAVSYKLRREKLSKNASTYITPESQYNSSSFINLSLPGPHEDGLLLDVAPSIHIPAQSAPSYFPAFLPVGAGKDVTYVRNTWWYSPGSASWRRPAHESLPLVPNAWRTFDMNSYLRIHPAARLGPVRPPITSIEILRHGRADDRRSRFQPLVEGYRDLSRLVAELRHLCKCTGGLFLPR